MTVHRYVLTRATLGAHPELPLSESEYDALVAATESLQEVLAFEERLDLLLANYAEFEHDLLSLTLAYALTDGGSGEWSEYVQMIQDLGRRLASLLTSTRAYLDQLPRMMAALYGPDALQVEQVRSFCSTEYDAGLGYRVCEALRNHAQHRGSAVHGITMPNRAVERRTGRPTLVYTATPRINTAELRADSQFKRPVLKELEALGDTHELKPFVREYVSAIGRVHVQVRALIAPDRERWETAVADAVQAFTEAPGSEGSAIGLAAMAVDDRGVARSGSVVAMMMEPAHRARRLAQKHADPTHFAQVVVTSASAI